MDSNVKFVGLNAEFLAFSPLEVRFLVDSSSCRNNKSLTNTIVMVVPYFFDQTPPSNSSCSNTWHTHMYTNNSDDCHRASTRAVRVVPLTAELRGCVYYCQHLTVVAISLVRTLSSHC